MKNNPSQYAANYIRKISTVLFFFVVLAVSCLYYGELASASQQVIAVVQSVRQMLMDKSIFSPAEEKLNAGMLKALAKVIPEAAGLNVSGSNLNAAFAKLQNQYPDRFNAAAEKAVFGLAESVGDPYTAVLTKEDMDKDRRFATDGSFSGIGVELAWKGGLMAAGTVPGSPAERKGLLPGDFIVAVDGQPVKGMTFYRAGDLLAGPAGSTAVLDIVRRGKSLRLEIVRASLSLPKVKGKMLNSDLGIGYIKIGYFSPTTGDEAAAELKKLRGGNLKKLVLDLRGNPGGDFKEGLRTAAIFKQGELVIVKRRDSVKRMKNSQGAAFNGPIAVLADRGTASSA
ncbi:PDZ domain-containing protein, partial [bacterium]|nr:PDZ domain-containing protein [bacterium]